MNTTTIVPNLPRSDFSTLMLLALLLSSALLPVYAQTYSGNPILPGYKADPDILSANGKYYIYPTSTAGNEFRAYSSTDLTNWVDEGVIFDLDTDCSWANDRPWAPTVVYRNNQYYFYYSASIKIGVAVSSSPTGPFTDIGQPLIGSDPHTIDIIDPDVFVNDDGRAYIYYGGSNGSRMVYRELNPDMVSIANAPQDITPPNYTEAPKLFKRNGTYYMMYSNGSWFNSSYNVRYATSTSPIGPWTYKGQVLSSSGAYDGPGHHGVLRMTGCDEYYIIYHRYENGDYSTRYVAIDRMYFNADGSIQRVQMTNNGVPARNISDPCQPGLPSSTTIAEGIYELEPQCAIGKLLTETGSVPNGDARIFGRSSSNAQKWKVTNVGDGYYELEPQSGLGSRLDVAGANTANGTNVGLWYQNGNNAQKWRFLDRGNEVYELEPKNAPGKRLDVSGGINVDNTNVQIYQANDLSPQRWKLRLVNANSIVSGSIYELEPQCAPGKRLDVAGASSSNGANVQIYQENGDAAQSWKIEAVGGGYYELEPQCALGKRLDVAGTSSTNGTNIHLWQDFSNAAQRWKIMNQGNGYYELEPQCAPGKRLDVAGMSSDNGTNIHLWQDYSNAAQRWKLILKSSSARTVSEKIERGMEETLVKQLQVYPNPVKDQLQVIAPASELVTKLRIQDLLGRLWLEKVLPKSQSVNVSRLPPGVYTLSLQQGAEIQTQKLVIEP